MRSTWLSQPSELTPLAIAQVFDPVYLGQIGEPMESDDWYAKAAEVATVLEERGLSSVYRMLSHRQIATTSRYVHATGAPAGHVLAKSIEESVNA